MEYNKLIRNFTRNEFVVYTLQPNLEKQRKFNFLTIGIDIVKGDNTERRVRRRFRKYMNMYKHGARHL